MAVKCNVGLLEQVVRIVLGVILFVLAVSGMLSDVWKIVSLALALILWITAAMRYCPITAALGINTCERVEEKAEVVSMPGQKTKSKRKSTKEKEGAKAKKATAKTAKKSTSKSTAKKSKSKRSSKSRAKSKGRKRTKKK